MWWWRRTGRMSLRGLVVTLGAAFPVKVLDQLSIPADVRREGLVQWPPSQLLTAGVLGQLSGE